MFKKPRKKIYIAVSFLVLLIAALGMVIAIAPAGVATHATLYTDIIKSKSSSIVAVNDELDVTSSGSGIVPAAVEGTHAANLHKGYLGVQAYGVLGTNANSNWGYFAGANYGAYGEHEGSDNFGYLGSIDYGAYGENNNGNSGYLGGASIGVNGFSSSGTGVKGTSLVGGGTGVWGVSDSGKAMYAYASGTATYALHAYTATSGGTAILAQTLSSTGYSGLFNGGQGVKIYGGGLCVDVDSNCDPDASGDGWVRARGYFTGDADIAEYYPSEENLESGDIVIIDVNNPLNVKKADKPYDSLVAGIISTEPGVKLGKEKDNNLLALAGRVPTKVSAENGPIEIGDLLTTSNTPGHAMRCKDRFECSGVMLGKALEPLDKGTGKIVVLVTLA